MTHYDLILPDKKEDTSVKHAGSWAFNRGGSEQGARDDFVYRITCRDSLYTTGSTPYHELAEGAVLRLPGPSEKRETESAGC